MIDWLTEPFSYAFFTRAMIAGVLIGAMCGALSVFIVLRRMSYIGHGLAHSVLGGVAVGVALGYDLYVGAIAATLLSALLIDRVTRRRGLHADAAIGIVTTAIFAIGVTTLSVLPTRVNIEAMLFGNILGVTRVDIGVAAGVACAFAIGLFVFYKPLVFATFDPEVAAVQGVRTGTVELVFNLLTAAVVVASVRVLGVLLIAAAVVIPAALARLITQSFGKLLAIATTVGVTASVTGLYTSYYVNVPSGPTIVLTGALLFSVTFAVSAVVARGKVQRARRHSFAASLLIVLTLAVLVAACGDAAEAPGAEREPTASPESPTPTATPDPAPTPEAVAAPALTVVSTVAPLADLVTRVAGERVTVETLVPPGADSHTYEPRPRDVAVFAEADAFLGLGLDLNPGAVRLAEEHLPDGTPVVLLGERGLDRAQLIHDHDHDDGHGHTHGDDGHTHDDENGLGPNPHVWTSVRLAMELVDAITEALADLDPDGAKFYTDNARAYLLELRALDEAIAAATETIPEGNRTLVTYHDAWGYFGRDYDLASVTAVQPIDFSEPSAAEVRDTIDLIRELQVPAIFGSEVFPNDVLDAIAQETGATYVGDLADDVLPGDPGDAEHSYLGLMRRNAALIVDALGGDPATLE